LVDPRKVGVHAPVSVVWPRQAGPACGTATERRLREGARAIGSTANEHSESSAATRAIRQAGLRPDRGAGAGASRLNAGEAALGLPVPESALGLAGPGSALGRVTATTDTSPASLRPSANSAPNRTTNIAHPRLRCSLATRYDCM